MDAQEFRLAVKHIMDNAFEKSIEDITIRLCGGRERSGVKQIDDAIVLFKENLGRIIDNKVKSIIERHKDNNSRLKRKDFLEKLRKYNDSTTDPGTIKFRVPYKDTYVSLYGNPSLNQVFGYVNDIMADFIRRFQHAPEE